MDEEALKKCRMCLNSASQLISMDTIFESASSDISFSDAYNFCTNLNVQATDCLPKSLCENCADDLKFVFEVLNRALESDHLLREIFENDLRTDKESDDEKLDKLLNDLSDADIQRNDESVEDDEIEELIYLDDDEFERLSEKEEATETAIKLEASNSSCDGAFASENDFMENVSSQSDKLHAEDTCFESDMKSTETDDPLQMQRKQKKKSSSREFICEVCGKIFGSKQVLKVHNLVHTKEKNYHCNLCPKSYSTAFRFREHMRGHANVRPYECTYCKRSFSSKNTLTCHMRRHTGERPYKCEICGKSFSQSSIKKTHIALHTGKTVECPLCLKKFSRPSHLILHQRSHTGERPYVCHLCPNSYKQKSHLDRHVDTHMGVKHTCNICGKEYTKKGSLTTHMIVHTKSRAFNCEMCSQEFSTRHKLRRHKLIVHSNDAKVEVEERSPDEILHEIIAEESSQPTLS